MSRYIAVDVGGTNIKYALLDEEANILDQGEVPTPYESLEAFLQVLDRIYEGYKDQQPEALVMAAPGRIDTKTGYFHTGGALPYLYDVNVKKALADRIPLPFSVENDAKAAAMAELWKGSMKGVENGIVITFGTGIGGALIIEGRLYHGSTSAAGELSGVPTNWNTRLPDPGGNWTDINCVRHMLDKYADRKRLERPQVDGRFFFAALNDGDEAAADELAWFCDTTATGIFALQQILDVERVSIGGGISRQPAFEAALNKALDGLFERLSIWSPVSKPALSACTFSNDANLIGALYNHLNRENA